MNFRTELKPNESTVKINHSDVVFCLGSCFSDEIGNRLLQNKFDTLINPFGTQFHPLALENTLLRIYSKEHYSENEIYHYNQLHFSWDHSTAFSHPNPKKVLQKINTTIDKANTHLQKTQFFIITLGTAWAYFLTEGNFYVSNCHKVPQPHFEKKLLNVLEIQKSLHNLVLIIKDINPQAHIIFTISPVRHLRDGFIENNRSKAHLISALHHIIDETENTHYFPAYELVLDDLRNYRFYKKDLVHPNEWAVDYIWEKFSPTYFSESTQKINQKIQQLNTALNHSPLHTSSLAYKKFLHDTSQKLDRLQTQVPEVDWSKEKQIIKEKIQYVN